MSQQTKLVIHGLNSCLIRILQVILKQAIAACLPRILPMTQEESIIFKATSPLWPQR